MFGASSGFGGFGQQNQQANQQQQQPGATGGLFGAQPAAAGAQQQGTGFGGFGAAAPSTFGGFGGASTTQPAGTQPGPQGFTFGAAAQQPQASQTNAFGQQPKPAGFGGFGASATGASTTTGTGFGFGAQPQQQQQTSTFGGFGAKPAGTTGSTFGGFGSQTQQQPQQLNAFGAPAQQQAGGMFGGGMAATVGPVPKDGTMNPPYQPFVAQDTDTNGTTKTNFAYQSITCMPAYRTASLEELRLRDYESGRKSGNAGPTAGGMGGFGAQQQPQAGSGLFGAQQPAQQTNSLFGASTTQPATGGLFGQQQQQQQPGTTGGLFGAQPQQQQSTGGLFGAQPQQPATGGLFGAQSTTQPASTGFSFGGASNTTGAAGTTGGFSFGGAANNQQQAAKPGLFGGGFGQTAQQPAAGQSTGFSFGGAAQQPQQQQTGSTFGSGGLFGGASTAAPASGAPATTGFGGFGASAAGAAAQKPAFSFGGGATSTGFGASAAPAAGGLGASTTGGGLFGAAPTTTSQPTGGLFGAAPAAGGATGTTGFSFGGAQNTQQQQQTGQQAGTTGFGGFGQPAASGAGTTGGLFGAKPAGTGLFGSSTTQPAQQQPGQTGATGGLFGGFGGAQPAAGTTGGGLFGAQAGAAKPATGGLFGGGGFGATGQQQSGGLFGAQNNAGQTGTTGGLFGASTGGGGLFGSSAAATSQPGGSLFGGGASTAGAGLGGSLFGSSTLGGNQQQQLQQSQATANFQPSLSSNPYGTDALFGGAGGAAGGLNGAGLSNQAPLPFNVSTSKPSTARKPPPLIPAFRPSTRNAAAKVVRARGGTPAGGASGFGASTFRESTPGAYAREGTPGAGAGASGSLFGSTSTYGRFGSPSAASGLFRSSTVGPEDGMGRESSLPPQAFITRSSVKKLVIDDRPAVNGSGTPTVSRSIFGSSSRAGSVAPGAGGSPAPNAAALMRGATVPPRVTFSPALETAAGGRGSPRPGNKEANGGLATGDTSFGSSIFDQTRLDNSPTRTVAGQRTGVTHNDPNAPLPALSLSTKQNIGLKAEDDNLPLDYYVEPSLSTLRTYSNAQLREVQGFAVGRRDIGEIRWNSPVDLTSFDDLSSIPGGVVQLRLKECFVYPEDDDCYDAETGEPLDGVRPGFDARSIDKAKRGSGLNKPATITLLQCWPLDRATRQPLKDAEHPRVKQHIAKLRKRKDTTFADFDAKSGAWTFEVEHFSRYGLDEDDSDEDGAAQKEQRKGAKAQPPAKRGGKVAPVADPSDMSEEEDEEEEDESAEYDAPAPRRLARGTTPLAAELEERSRGPAAPKPFGATLGVEARKVQVMQASFFGQQQGGERGADKSEMSGAKTGAATTAASRKHPRHSSLTPAATASRPTFSTTAPDTSASKTTGAAALVPNLAPAPRKFTRTELARSNAVEAGHEGLTIDAGLSLGRSFRPGWGPDGTLIHAGRVVGLAGLAGQRQDSDGTLSTLRTERFAVFKKDRIADEAKRAEKLLQLQLEHSEIAVDDDDEEEEPLEEEDDEEGQPRRDDSLRKAKCPIIFTRSDTRFSHFAAAYETGDNSHEASLWRLGHALFDEIDLRLPADAPRDVVDRVTALRRRAALSAWLAKAVAPIVDVETRSHIAAGRDAALVFSHLSGHQLERACMAAVSAGDVRLATLVAQAGSGDDEVRADIAEQLATWRKSGVDAHIAKDHRRIYELLSGNVGLSEGTVAGSVRDPIDRVEDLAIPAGLDWKRALGLHLWYGSPHDADLTDALRSYEAAIQGRSKTAAPLPPYAESMSKTNAAAPRDALFRLIELYAKPTAELEEALAPRGFGPALADHMLPWHLYTVLSRSLRKRDFADRIELGIEEAEEAAEEGIEGNSARADGVASAYAHQLELQGQWTWAAFVLLHLELPVSREKAVKELLGRHVASMTEEQETFLTQRLKVPVEWIFEARAHQARQADDRFAEYELLLGAKEFGRAHAVAVQKLAPEAVIRGDLDLVVGLFAPFAKVVGSEGGLAGWKEGGQVLVDYVACVRQLPPLIARQRDGLDAAAEAKLARLAPRVGELLDLVRNLFDGVETSLEQSVARSDMLAALHNLARVLSNRALAAEPSVAWDVLAPPEIEALQSAANDYCSLLIDATA